MGSCSKAPGRRGSSKRGARVGDAEPPQPSMAFWKNRLSQIISTGDSTNTTFKSPKEKGLDTVFGGLHTVFAGPGSGLGTDAQILFHNT